MSMLGILHMVLIDFYFGLATHIHFSYTCSLLVHNAAFAHGLTMFAGVRAFESIFVFEILD